MRTTALSFAVNVKTIQAERAPKLAKMRKPILALARREVSRSKDAPSFPPLPSRGPGLLARALRVLCIAQPAH